MFSLTYSPYENLIQLHFPSFKIPYAIEFPFPYGQIIQWNPNSTHDKCKNENCQHYGKTAVMKLVGSDCWEGFIVSLTLFLYIPSSP